MQHTTTSESVAPKMRGGAERAFRFSVLVSGIRCTLAYVVLPFVAPLLGLAAGIGPGLGMAIGTLAVVANVISARRFWRLRHPWRRPVTALHAAVIVFLLVLMGTDLAALTTPAG